MSNFTDQDRVWMLQAIELARSGQGWVEPNPMVGCVLVHNGTRIGSGYHQRFGGYHAERQALANVEGEIPRGCTAYVTLEPCCHHGKTPPCTDALIQAGVARVVVATSDPFEQVAGRGIAQLRNAGIRVDCGLEEGKAGRLLAPYLKRLRTGRPWLIAKWAMTMDGKIASRTGHSQWISCEASRREVHAIRGRMDAIVVGINTALADDPLLTVRPPGPRTPLRVIVDSHLRLPESSRLVGSAREFPLLIWAGPSADRDRAENLRRLGCQIEICSTHDRHERLLKLLDYLGADRTATNLLVEGGSELLGSLFDLQQIDQCEIFIAPKLLGGHRSPSPISGLGLDEVSQGPKLIVESSERLDVDIHVSCLVNYATAEKS